jgi:excisionase family DNA binding protein
VPKSALRRRTARSHRDFISVAEAAEYTGLGERTLRRYIAGGTLTGYRVGERLIKVDVAELDQLIRPIPAVSPR